MGLDNKIGDIYNKLMLEKAKKSLLRIRIARKKGAHEKDFTNELKKLISLKSRLPLQLLG